MLKNIYCNLQCLFHTKYKRQSVCWFVCSSQSYLNRPKGPLWGPLRYQPETGPLACASRRPAFMIERHKNCRSYLSRLYILTFQTVCPTFPDSIYFLCSLYILAFQTIFPIFTYCIFNFSKLYILSFQTLYPTFPGRILYLLIL